jgi:hypothetical protein
MASGIFFNYWGVTHVLELQLFEGGTVWRAIVDGSDVLFFEAEVGLAAVDLIDRAVDCWLAEGLHV